VHGAVEVVDEDRARNADLVPQPPCGRELVVERSVRRQMLARMRLARVDEVPAEAGVLRCELVEQRTLCCAVRSGEGAELEDDRTLAPQLRQPDAFAVEQRQLAVGSPQAGMQRVRKRAELALVLTALDVDVEALVVVRRAHQAARDVFLMIEFVIAP
jgi:hypothetical protein